MATPYVKFYRGTQDAFDKLTQKDIDTLYFIYSTDENIGKLYLGDKLISDNINKVADLEDLLLTNLADKDLLSYDAEQGKWVNKSVINAIGLMVGATEEEMGANGLVPAPGLGKQNAFLRGDGTWVEIEAGSDLTADEKSISIAEKVITLKDFGIKYYKYVPESGSEETGDYITAHYEAQLVDTDNPWVAGLEPRVVNENGELILGWFEPNPTTVDGIQNQVVALQGQVEAVSEKVDNVYTKEETATKINEAIATVDHLQRKTFETLEEAESFALIEGEDAINYIYMVKNAEGLEGNTYDEYLYVDGKLEQVGNWKVDLTDYATKSELTEKVDKVDGYSLVEDTEIQKLSTVQENAEPNFINSVNETELKVESGKLSIVSISTEKVNGLDTLLNNKADSSKVSELENTIQEVDGKVSDLTNTLNSYVLKDDFNTEINAIKDAITWKDIPSV